jgi:hypothetical protein
MMHHSAGKPSHDLTLDRLTALSLDRRRAGLRPIGGVEEVVDGELGEPVRRLADLGEDDAYVVLGDLGEGRYAQKGV